MAEIAISENLARRHPAADRGTPAARHIDSVKVRFFMRSLQTIGKLRVSTTENSSFFGARRGDGPPDAGPQTVPVRRAC
jgi:hypothetical protein